jgi:hypothetical protein
VGRDGVGAVARLLPGLGPHRVVWARVDFQVGVGVDWVSAGAFEYRLPRGTALPSGIIVEGPLKLKRGQVAGFEVDAPAGAQQVTVYPDGARVVWSKPVVARLRQMFVGRVVCPIMSATYFLLET